MLAKWRYAQFNSALLRSLLAYWFHEGQAYRVAFGPLRGARLYYDRSVNFHAILGLWDAEALVFLHRVLTRGEFLRQDMVVADVGANLGIFSLWFSRQLQGYTHHIVAFEPAPEALQKLRTNVALNESESCIHVVPMACSDREGTVEFFLATHHHVSSLIEHWAHSEGAPPLASVSVPTTTLDAYFESRGAPDFIKMDIEGGGVFALPGCHRILSQRRPLVWVESHTPAEDRAISDSIMRHRYRAYRLATRQFVTRPEQIHPDPDGVWGTLLLYPEEDHGRILRGIG